MLQLEVLLCGAALAWAGAASAPTPPDGNPAVWVVRDDDTTVYLFGTIHLFDGRVAWFNDEVQRAFEQSQEVVFEVKQPDPAAMGPLIARYGIDPDGPPLTQKPGVNAAALTREAEALGVPVAALEPLEPWLAGMSLAVLAMRKLGLDPEQGTEQVLTRAAVEAGKTVGELETVEQQLQFFHGLSEAQQVELLNAGLKQLAEAPATLGRIADAWSRGDADAVAAVMKEGMAQTPELAKILLTDRNARWAEWVEARLGRPGTVFVAVGAGHLAGEASVQGQLARRGIRTERHR
jgi:hypothetical protein